MLAIQIVSAFVSDRVGANECGWVTTGRSQDQYGVAVNSESYCVGRFHNTL